MIWLMYVNPNRIIYSHSKPIKFHIFSREYYGQQVAVCGRRDDMKRVKPAYTPLDTEICKSCMGALEWE